jgi:hypothetical protein
MKAKNEERQFQAGNQTNFLYLCRNISNNMCGFPSTKKKYFGCGISAHHDLFG